jgi:hypothetical protein
VRVQACTRLPAAATLPPGKTAPTMENYLKAVTVASDW